MPARTKVYEQPLQLRPGRLAIVITGPAPPEELSMICSKRVCLLAVFVLSAFGCAAPPDDDPDADWPGPPPASSEGEAEGAATGPEQGEGEILYARKCKKNTAMCIGEHTLRTCRSDGSGYIEMRCPFGCIAGRCRSGPFDPPCRSPMQSCGTNRCWNVPYGCDQCQPGYVWRDAFGSDHICVTGGRREQIATENANAHRTVDPECRAGLKTCPYGPSQCRQGYVWRDLRRGDHVCVTGDSRQLGFEENQKPKANRVVR
jgi:hypothetical protein